MILLGRLGVWQSQRNMNTEDFSGRPDTDTDDNKCTLLAVVKWNLVDTRTQGHATDLESACGALESVEEDVDIGVPGPSK